MTGPDSRRARALRYNAAPNIREQPDGALRFSREPLIPRWTAHDTSRPQGSLPRRRSRHAVPAGDQVDAEGDAAGGGQAAHPVRGGGGAGGGHRAIHLRYRSRQIRARGPFRSRLRARGDAARARQGRGDRRRQRLDAEAGPALLHAPAAPARPRPYTNRYVSRDVVEEDGVLVRAKGVIEKPTPEEAPSTLAVIGRYILEAEVFEHLGRIGRGAGNAIQIPAGPARMIGGKHAFHGFRFAGRRFDCGDKAGFLEATVACALARPDLAGDMRRILDEHSGDRAPEPADRKPAAPRRKVS